MSIDDLVYRHYKPSQYKLAIERFNKEFPFLKNVFDNYIREFSQIHNEEDFLKCYEYYEIEKEAYEACMGQRTVSMYDNFVQCQYERLKKE